MKVLKTFLLSLCFLFVLTVSGCANENINSLKTPSNINVYNGVIIFDAVKDAEQYIININNQELIIDSSYNNDVSIIDSKINYNANKLFKIGESYSIKIKATSSEKEDSEYSNPISYKHSTKLDTPKNIKIVNTILTWDVVNNADLYLIKILAPYNQTILDKEGNELFGDDPETISKADITEYSFTTNSFNFNSLLTEAGIYKFYINAVNSTRSSYSESGYTSKITYTHQVKLSTPICGMVKDTSSELSFNAIIDKNSTSVTVTCDGRSETRDLLNITDPQSLSLTNNMLKVNLKNLFPDIQFSIAKQYKVEIQTHNNKDSYLDSDTSTSIIFEKTQKLFSPTNLQVSYNEKHFCYEASWDYADTQNISGFQLFVYNGENYKLYELDKSINTMLLPNDFQSIFIKTLGKGNFLSSNFGFANNPTINVENSAWTISANKNLLEFTDLQAGEMYIVEYESIHQVITSNCSYSIDLSNIKTPSLQVYVTKLSPGYASTTKYTTLANSSKLPTPEITDDQGFTNSNPYLLTFNPVNNAFGYYVHIATDKESSQIETIYTSTSIDLYQYLVARNLATTYYVKIQAIADPNSNYQDSDLSEEILVKHSNVLKAPQFSTPAITKTTKNGSTIYYVNFYGVENAYSYELLVNYNKIEIIRKSDNFTGEYNIDITRFLTAANKYEFKLRALPYGNTDTLLASSYSTTSYTLGKQLSTVTNIKIAENDGKYTLSFDAVDNAAEYEVRIVKLSDNGYYSYLTSINKEHPIKTNQSVDVTDYVLQNGEYYFYVTAKAPTNGYYSDANESQTYAKLNKLTTLRAPTDIEFENKNKNNYLVTWTGDNNADYYLIKITDPNGFTHELQARETTANISNYLSIQGSYTLAIYSKVNPTSESSKTYESSSVATISTEYSYTEPWDFERYSISMYGEKSDYMINSFNDLKTVLWYNYLYKQEATGFKIYIQKEAQEATIRESILRLADETTSSGLYNFSLDSTWTNTLIIESNNKSDTELLKYVCEKILISYPELNELEDLTINRVGTSLIFDIHYINALNTEKNQEDYSEIKAIIADDNYSGLKTLTTENYSNKFVYLSKNVRRGDNYGFKIDSRPEEMLVSTTEELIHAVEYGYRPTFYKDSSVYKTAETVYLNAKQVLLSIITDNMSDIEKATKIFDWISYSYDLNLYANKEVNNLNSIEDANIKTYGLRQDFYLEGILLNITNEDRGNFDGEFYLGNRSATSSSYSKAFSLLCGIEGINAKTVVGTILEKYGTNETYHRHTWNKIELDGKWYNVDIMNSDNTSKVNTSDTTIYYDSPDKPNSVTTLYSYKSISTASHNYFLVADDVMEKTLRTNITYNLFSAPCSNSYNYYANSSFNLTSNEIRSLTDVENIAGFNYSKQFNPNASYSNYETYFSENSLQAMIINLLLYAKANAQNNKCCFEFSFLWESNGGSGSLNSSYVSQVISSKLTELNNYKHNLEIYNPAVGEYPIFVTYDKTYDSTSSNSGRTIVVVALNFK